MGRPFRISAMSSFLRLERPPTDLSILWVDTWKIDFVDELNSWWLVRVVIAAVHLERVDSVLVDTL